MADPRDTEHNLAGACGAYAMIGLVAPAPGLNPHATDDGRLLRVATLYGRVLYVERGFARVAVAAVVLVDADGRRAGSSPRAFGTPYEMVLNVDQIATIWPLPEPTK